MIVNVFIDVIPNGRLLSQTLEDLERTHVKRVTYCRTSENAFGQSKITKSRPDLGRLSPAYCCGDLSKVPNNFLWNLRWKK